MVDSCVTAGVPRLVYVSSPSVAHAGTSLIGRAADPADPVAAHAAVREKQGRRGAARPGRRSRPARRSRCTPHLVWGPGDTQLVARVVDRARHGRLPLIGSGAA